MRVYIQAPAVDGVSPPFGHAPLDGTLTGVWGLDDEHVFVWAAPVASPSCTSATTRPGGRSRRPAS